jgi:hypothetical protein
MCKSQKREKRKKMEKSAPEFGDLRLRYEI